VHSKSQSEVLQKFHDTQDRLRKELERVNCPKLLSKNVFMEQYSKGNMSAVFYVEAIGDFNVVGRVLHCGPESLPIYPTHFVLKLDALNGSKVNEWEENPVLIHVTSLVDGPNGGIPSLVRLYLINENPKKFGEIAVYFSLFKMSPHLIRMNKNREFISEVTAERLGGQSFADFPPCMVEGAIQVMDGIADHESYVGSGLSVAKIVLDEFLSSVRIRLDGGGVRISQGLDSRLNINDVLIGPINLQVGIAKNRAHKKEINTFG
jgi:hypothetical protein